MTKLVEWRVFLPTLAALGALAFFASRFLDVPLLPAFGVLLTALLVNGFVATLEDHLPGGFNNPDGTQTPPYARETVRIARWLLSVLLCVFAVAFSVGGFRAEAEAPILFVVGVSLGFVLLALALLRRSRSILWLALLTAFGSIGLTALLQ